MAQMTSGADPDAAGVQRSKYFRPDRAEDVARVEGTRKCCSRSTAATAGVAAAASRRSRSREAPGLKNAIENGFFAMETDRCC